MNLLVGADALVMDDRDHVATLLRDMQAGEIRKLPKANGRRLSFSDTRNSALTASVQVYKGITKSLRPLFSRREGLSSFFCFHYTLAKGNK